VHRERSLALLWIGLLLDVLLTLGAFVLAYAIKTRWLPEAYQVLAPMAFYGWIVLLYLLTLLTMFYLAGFYTFGRTVTYFDLFLGIAKAQFATLTLVILLLFVLKVQDVSRLLLFIYAAVGWAVLLAGKAALKLVAGRLQRRGYDAVTALVCGTGTLAESVIDNLHRRPDLGYRVVGCIDVDPERLNTEVGGVRVIGLTSQLGEILTARSIDEVFFAIPSHLVKDLDKLVYNCEEVGVRANIVWDLYRPAIAKTVMREFLDVPVLTFTATPMQVGQLMVKRAIDLVGGVLGLVVAAPLIALVAVLIKATSPGPVLFTQVRSGLNGRTFPMLKFRTMVRDAEQRRHEVEHLNEMSGPVFKATHDPRVTRVGRWLRRTSIDELPQLINVVKGEMSLVGPRPPIPDEVARYERWQRRRLSMKPGLTCFWQINGRNAVDFGEWMRLDLRYIDNWSLALDLKILLATIPVVFSRRGAV
jgi:exopolysaccharide biosynthesis polyprenyl glycosylphosphotransferase